MVVLLVQLKKFTSAEITISSFSTKTTLAHNLGAIPFQMELFLICKTVADGYAVGDIIKVTQSYHSTAGTSDIGAIMSCDATNIFLTTGGNSWVCLKVLIKILVVVLHLVTLIIK